MDIQLKNYNKKSFAKYEVRVTNNNVTKFNTQPLDLDILNISTVLKQNTLLSPESDYKVKIIFENFTNVNSILFNIKKNFHNLLSNLKLVKSEFLDKAWSVDFKNEIHITNKIYSKDTSFTEYLTKNLSNNEVLNYVFLHELGHSIHSELKNKTGLNFSAKNNLPNNIQNFLNQTIPFTQVSSLSINSASTIEQRLIEKELNLATHYGMKEGFADLYACIAVSIIYPKVQAENIINKVVEARNYTDKWTAEFYHSKNSIEIFLEDFKNGVTSFTSFADIQNYIEKTTANTIINNLAQEINTKNDNNDYINYYFGVLKNKLKPQNTESLNDIISYINKTYDFDFNQREENAYFQQGFKNSFKNSPNPRIDGFKLTNKIGLLRNQFLNNSTQSEIECNLRK